MIKFVFIFIISVATFFVLSAEPLLARIVLAVSVFAALFLISVVEARIQRSSVKHVFAGLVGLVGGLIVSRLVQNSVLPLLPAAGLVFYRLVLDAVFAYAGYVLFYDNIGKLSLGGEAKQDKDQDTVNFTKYKILDTSSIIDGRIMDLSKTKFLEGIYLIPRFVLQELQLISDSSDSMKRQKGRRGLDLVAKMQKSEDLLVQIVDKDFPDIRGVDMKLVALAEELKAAIVTTDFNLNKVAQIHNIKIFNVNQLAEVMRPIVMPGEVFDLLIMKLGKDQNQGIGYLEDGTMVVVENASRWLKKRRKVEVTSVVQTESGRMIFAK
jgi:uncharacterized protein YacL